MSESEFSSQSSNSWRPISVCTQNQTDGLNLRELILDGLDSGSKKAIIEFLRGYSLDVTGVDNDTYTVDLTKWDRNKSEQFVQFLKAMGGNSPDVGVENHKAGSSHSETVLSAITSSESMEEGNRMFDELRPKKEEDIPRTERRFPIQPHPAEELDFEYLENTNPFPVQTNPIYQKDELLHIKPMLINEETQSTMGSANTGFGKINKNCFSYKCVIYYITYPFRLVKRLKIWRSLRKHLYSSKSKEEKMRKEKAFAVYTTLLEEGPRYGREFKASLKGQTSAWRTVATNTWPKPQGDDWSLNSEILKVNRGINAVCHVTEIGINTCHVQDMPFLRNIPKVFSEPEEEPIIWCPCQFIASSFLYKCISKCLGYVCDWETCNTELIEQDIVHQKKELKEVRTMLVGALELLEKARKSNNE